jgi:hypothetical protein
MINLCNTTSYSNDKQGQNLTKRTPRGNEDIEIIGDIDQNTVINLSQLESTCGLGNISSLTLPFKTNRVYTLTIAGNGPILDPNNPRAPTGTELENITRTNPLRVQHGWYTMMTGYGIGILTTNSSVSLTNIPFKNSTINAIGVILNSSAYCNGILNVNNSISLKNTSYLYGTTIECTGITLESNSKCDTINIASNTLTLNNSSIAESQFFGSGVSASGSNIIDCEITCENLQITDANFQSRFDYNERSSGNIEDIKFTDSIIHSNSQINSKFLWFNNVDIGGGKINSDVIRFEGSCRIGGDATVDAQIISGSEGLLNEGILNFNSFSGLTTRTIANIGNININNTENIDMVITNNGRLKLATSGTFLGGNNNGIINGSSIKLKKGFINLESGEILSSMTELEDSAINNGYITTAKLSDSSQNNGSLDSGIFSGQGVLNNGLVKIGLFLNSNNNGEVTNLTIYSATNYGSGTEMILHNSTNNGSYPYFDAYGESIYESSYPTISGNFYDTSTCNFIVGSGQSSVTNFYNSSIFDGSANNLNISFFDNSTAQGTIVGTATFYNNSSYIGEGTINNAIFQDTSHNKGIISQTATFIDNSINSGNLGPGLSVATFNKSKNYGIINGQNVYFSGEAINEGQIFAVNFNSSDSVNSASGTISLTTSSPSVLSNFINSGILNGTFYFQNNSINYGIISGSGIFDATSINSGTIIQA